MAQTTEACLKKALRGLPRSPDRIAKRLQGQGIVGRKGVPFACPIAVYLKGHCSLERIHVSGYHVVLAGGNVRLPRGVQKFVQNFDANNYPDLILES